MTAIAPTSDSPTGALLDTVQVAALMSAYQTATEGAYTSEFVLNERRISREQVVIDVSAPAMVPGTLLGLITASGKYTAYSDGATDGSQTAVGVLISPVPDLSVDQKTGMVARMAEVALRELSGVDAAGTDDLRRLNIIAR